ncbi:hypothetical protein RQM59_09095 [Flavobacteriaceae bacterium S356]|uniref:SnoaL-like domain-containing protein n=1 Tax=Asprobacillus argus TaxID=3076534 RepID=A0ABU3LFL7_9FLAO|nr:hypothetical protein [Flavobacteriaceae bacterium S356]
MTPKRSTLYHRLLILSFLFISFNLFSQGQKLVKIDEQIIASIKKDVWIPFMESYRELNTDKLVSLHSSNITRVSVDLNKIEFGEDYLKNLGKLFQQIKKMNIDIDIKFSIISSATSENMVYQTGYYVFSTKAKEEKSFKPMGYSSFNVMITKENGTWKISSDTDKKAKLTHEEFLKSGTIYALD